MKQYFNIRKLYKNSKKNSLFAMSCFMRSWPYECHGLEVINGNIVGTNYRSYYWNVNYKPKPITPEELAKYKRYAKTGIKED